VTPYAGCSRVVLVAQEPILADYDARGWVARLLSRGRLLDLFWFGGCFALGAWLGRLSVIPGTELALVWPAAGVAAAWLAVAGWSGLVLVDAAILFVLSAGANGLTGAGIGLSVGLALATVVQTLVFGVLINRWCPGWWGFGEEPPPGVERVRDFGYLALAALIASVVAAVLGPAAVITFSDTSWEQVVSWVLRNGTSVLAIFPLTLTARHLTRASNPQHGPVPVGPMRGRGPAELVALVLVSLVVLWLVFFETTGLPIPFLALAVSVWAGTRFSPVIADGHAFLLGGAVAVATVLGLGPFMVIENPDSRALVVQAYVAMVVVLTLVLSVGRVEILDLNDRVRAQGTMVRTIVDSMADGLSVIDSRGTVVLRNPAAAYLVGSPQQDESGTLDIDAYGLRHADGRALSPEESPMALALTGGTIEKDVLFVRNPAVPEGRLLEVSARPLPDSDPPMVVVLFHDVTAERRERDELASFAGVVAHDLLNPLTVVDGWSEALLEEARAGGPSDPATRAERLERIQRSAQRMQRLISDLLAYTTARDLTISPVRVDLDDLVGDVIRARADASRASGQPEPRILIEGKLPDVMAEPVLLRQVVDNLIGNAVKYVAPDVIPEIRVCARTVAGAAGQMAVIEISDNGIGIPDGQHEQVFDSFHRAHRDGYRGTGLGLSIVKRIVERHGGTADARDNHGSDGTTMTVSFPAADPEQALRDAVRRLPGVTPS